MYVPTIDLIIYRHFIYKVKFAPFFLLFNGYWMVSNTQIFENKWSYIEWQTDKMPSGHFLEFKMNYTAPILILIFLTIFISLIQWLSIKLGLANEYDDLQINENLPIFYKAIRYSSARQIIAES